MCRRRPPKRFLAWFSPRVPDAKVRGAPRQRPQLELGCPRHRRCQPDAPSRVFAQSPCLQPPQAPPPAMATTNKTRHPASTPSTNLPLPPSSRAAPSRLCTVSSLHCRHCSASPYTSPGLPRYLHPHSCSRHSHMSTSSGVA
jgi:hypothetical protein